MKFVTIQQTRINLATIINFAPYSFPDGTLGIKFLYSGGTRWTQEFLLGFGNDKDSRDHAFSTLDQACASGR
jgi:hypothetical protein